MGPLGNFHAILTFKTEEELKTVRKIVHRMVEHALALDGTCRLSTSEAASWEHTHPNHVQVPANMV